MSKNDVLHILVKDLVGTGIDISLYGESGDETLGLDFDMCFIRNREMDNTLSLADSSMLSITNKAGVVLTVDNLPDYDKFDETGWVAMLCDADKTNTPIDPTPTGDYLYKEFCVINRTLKTLTIAGKDLSAWEVGDNLILYNPFLNYTFVGDQGLDALIPTIDAPAWRSTYSLAGPIFKDSNGIYKWFIMGYHEGATPSQTIGYATSTDMVSWIMGNSDLPIVVAADVPDCTVGLVVSGNILNLGSGNYAVMIGYSHNDTRILLRIMYFNEDFSTITFGPIIFNIAAGLRNIHPSLYRIGNEFHISYYTRTGSDLTTSELTFAKSATLDGVYTPYQILLSGATANDGTPWSNNVDTSCIFEIDDEYFCFFGGTSKWSQGGNKGNREFCLATYDEDTETWTASPKSPVIINPLYWANLVVDSYNWAADHVGSTPSIFIDGTDVYMTCSMNYGTNGYKATILKLTYKAIAQHNVTD